MSNAVILPSLRESDLHPALEAGTCPPDEMFFLPADAHHHRCIGFFRQQCRDNREDVTSGFAAESASGVLADEHNLVGVHIQPASQAGQSLHRALSAHVDEYLAVLPICQSGARFESLMAAVRRREGFIQNQCGVLETSVNIAIGPLVWRFAHRQTAFLYLGEVCGCPFQFSYVRRRRAGRLLAGLGRFDWGFDPNIPFRARVGPARAETVERVNHERQVFKFDVDVFDGLRGSQFVHRRYSQDRLALVQGFHGECFFALHVGLDHRTKVGHAVSRSWKIILREDCFDPGHRQSFTQIKMFHASVRHGAKQQLAEKHAFGAKVFGVFRPTSHLRVEIGRCVILANELVLGTGLRLTRFLLVSALLIGFSSLARHGSPSSGFLRLASLR